MIVSSVIAADCKKRDFTTDTILLNGVRYHQEDVQACKLVHVVGYANPNPTELFLRLATLLIVTGHLVIGSLNFFGFGPSVVTQRNLWNKPFQNVVTG